MQRPSLKYERELWRKGSLLVAGIDEAGRGPLAGPVVAAAVVFPVDIKLAGLADSKLLNDKKRQQLYKKIRRLATAVGVGIVSNKQIDRFGIGRADVLAMRMAVENLGIRPDHLLIDGLRVRLGLGLPQEHIIKGDRKCASIAAASIIAKVTRDRIMDRFHKKYPGYGFNSHRGYGTAKHLRSLRKHGSCPIHRRSFAPVQVISQTQLELLK
ncbi:MAG: ribonuclease HII [Candidatus Saganbacteria bacterium]|nr:ribonuclease HII [Candidatus Saganbacteria bacterium]